jgi:two-component system, OmpR family, sensor histidine kinase KdpD
MAATRTDGRLTTDLLAVVRPRASRPSRVSALVISAALVAASTAFVAAVTPSVPVRSAGVFYLLAVLAVSSIYGLWWGLATSLASALAFNFFFLPPAHTLVIDSSSDWLALAAFAVTAVVTSDLAARERRGREEAARRAEEARLGERLATAIATAANLDDALAGLGDEAAQTLGAESGVIVRGPAATGGPDALPLELNGRLIGELRLTGGAPELRSSAASMRVARQLAGLIALGEERERRIREQVNAEALLRSDELKTALLRAVSHDLRSPLQAISAASGGLRFAALDDDEQELLDTIGAESGRMSRMIENLLDLSRLNAGALPPAPDWLDPRELVEAAVAELFRGEPNARIRVEVAADVPLVRGDGPQLQRAVVNVLENALKFSGADQDVEVGIARRGDAVEIAVRDRGPGVASEDAERIFEPFARGGRTRDVPGSGLGLAIARGLAVANGARLRLAAETDGGGSTFILELPAARSEADA